MPKKQTVSIRTQTIFIFLSFFNIWAYYRIGKLRRWLLNNVLSIAIFWISLFFTNWVFGILEIENESVKGFSAMISLIDLYIVQFILAAIQIRKWSRDWNEKVKSN